MGAQETMRKSCIRNARKRFAEGLRAHRTRDGWTQAELAKACGMQPSHIAHFEAGRRSPSLANLVILSNVIGCTIDALCGYSAVKP